MQGPTNGRIVDRFSEEWDAAERALPDVIKGRLRERQSWLLILGLVLYVAAAWSIHAALFRAPMTEGSLSYLVVLVAGFGTLGVGPVVERLVQRMREREIEFFLRHDRWREH